MSIYFLTKTQCVSSDVMLTRTPLCLEMMLHNIVQCILNKNYLDKVIRKHVFILVCLYNNMKTT